MHDIGIALLYFTPAFYCDTTDSLLFPNKWHRLWVTTAGIYIEGFICIFATSLWVASYPDTLLHELAFKTMLFTGVSTIFFNINPLIKIDGYYALSSLLEIPSCARSPFATWARSSNATSCGCRSRFPRPPGASAASTGSSESLALAYVGVLMSFITGLFHNLYDRIVPNFAIPLLLLTIYRIFRKRVRLVTRTARLFYLDKKELLMSPRSRTALFSAAALIAAALLLPWSRRTISAPALLKPMTTVRLEAPEDAVVARPSSCTGDRRRRRTAGILSLSSPALAEATGRVWARNAARKASQGARRRARQELRSRQRVFNRNAEGRRSRRPSRAEERAGIGSS